MAVWTCADCTTTYSVGAPKCPQCGSVVRIDERTQPREEGAEDMAKTTVHGGPSDVYAEERGEDVSAGTSSSTSSETESSTPEQSEQPNRSPARTTASRSKKAATGKGSSARSTDGGPAADTSVTASADQ